MAKIRDKVLEEIKARLIEALNPKKIYLFGSRARGDHNEDSDYDLLLIIGKTKLNRHERNLKGRNALWGVRAAVDIFVYTQAEFDEWKNELSSIPETVLYEGKELSLE